MSEHYRYKGNIYRLVGHSRHKCNKTREWIATAMYTDGNEIFTREVGEFYERFTQIPSDSLEVATFNLKQQTQK